MAQLPRITGGKDRLTRTALAAWLVTATAGLLLPAASIAAEVAKLVPSDFAPFDRFGASVSVDGDTAVIGAYRDDGNTGSAYVFRYDGTAWLEEAKLTASDAAAGDVFGETVSVDGDTAVIGAAGNDDNGSASGSAYVFRYGGAAWVEEAKLTASDAAALDRFGASVSVDGDTAVIGALEDDDNGDRSGSAYVFRYNGATWLEEAKLTASDGAELDRFGVSVSVSGDTAVIGALEDDDNGSASGAAYVFRRDGTAWLEEAKLTASDGATDDLFGETVSVDGDAAVIGADGDDDDGSASGSAYVFRYGGTAWLEEAKLTASDAAALDRFGASVSVDGDTAVIGALEDDDNGSASGSAYVFRYDGTAWLEEAKLTASDGASGDFFGVSVSVDGDTAVIGADGDDGDMNAGNLNGSAYVFSLPEPAAFALQMSALLALAGLARRERRHGGRW